jgi:imidazolonepropionase-like amidohydrolase
MQQTAIVNGTLIDGTGRDPIPRAAVLLDGDRITHVGPTDQLQLPRDARVIDASGHTILPGFVDAHTHLTYRDHDLRRHLLNPPSYNLLRSTQLLRATVEAGVTTCRELGGADAGLRRAVVEGVVLGPRLLVAVAMISQTGGHGDAWVPAGVRVPKRPWLPNGIADGVDQVRQVTREMLRAGADVVKICATGGITSPTDDYWEAQYTVEELAAAVYEAAQRGKPVAAHAEGLAGIRNSLRAGVHSVEHGWFMDEECLELMLRQGTWWVPTLALVPLAYERRRADPASVHQASADVLRKDEEVYRLQQAQAPLWRRAVERGVKVAMGTDQSTRLLTGENLVELRYMVESLGMSPMQAIVASTRSAAACLGLPDLGTLEPGKLADLTLFDGDPLADIHSLGDPARMKLVLKAGAVCKDALQPPRSA